MPFDSESGKKHGKGRPKGAKNKKTKEDRERIRSILFDDWDKVIEDLAELSPRERLDFKAKLMPFVVSKLSSSESKLSFDVSAMTDEQIDRQFDRIINQNNNSDEEE